ncbi:SH3 domain-containing protein [Treponema sp. R6D11]
MNKLNRLLFLFSLFLILALSSCSKLGYGVLLWSIDEPPVDSGSVLPVYIKSNIEKIWVVGIPEKAGTYKGNKKEIPLTQLEFIGSKRKAEKWAENFAPYATLYAENLQDGLPIRSSTDNNSKRVYRLRLGEVVKVLGVAKGIPPISTTGDPLPGEWYKVLTNDGAIGYCFSFRLKLFTQNEGSVQYTASVQKNNPDPDLDMVLSKIWSSEIYSQMINSGRIDIQELEKNYRFDPGQDTGVARIILPDLERQFTYQRIISEGERSWNFEGTNLIMALKTNNTLSVQFTENSGIRRTLLFSALSAKVDDLIIQENARRETQFLTIYNQGPVFSSNNYGTITLLQTGDFTWTGYDLLVPQIISAETKGGGRISMDLYIPSSFEEKYNGAFTLRFTDTRQNNTIYFLYALDNQGLRLEVVPDYGIENTTVIRRASSPVVLYFFKDTPH